MQQATLNVKGMSCNHCVQAVEGAVRELGAEGKVHLAAGTATVTYDETKVTREQLAAAIEEQGYDVV
ncbi:heavy-metal-associated domain-containing protein [Paenibacillus sp. IB182496]|uniref:Heavy-metal-associated domain-containing protein n=1 Tax=Paenibacillus sabuli TaxID=2772509 RepID=A0A927BY25_9BACL|nr:copper ion binding protein [Paenibacillus sabuli]MBD2847850.1 heavy-metal-associated domain-containing protein [Paenibacillus sabuli]